MVTTKVSVRDGEKEIFRISPWLDGIWPPDVAPLLFKESKMQNFTVKKSLDNNIWISNLNMDNVFIIIHIQQFVTLCELLAGIQLAPGTAETILWKVTSDGKYSASSTYKMQFERIIFSYVHKMVWIGRASCRERV